MHSRIHSTRLAENTAHHVDEMTAVFKEDARFGFILVGFAGMRGVEVLEPGKRQGAVVAVQRLLANPLKPGRYLWFSWTPNRRS
ncbi:MAG TPA: hypothetical protein VFL57_19580 [Bryobacteraceae bacterium]|nr:hypothetical protein [Bryobacteraceae bacterium]